MTRPCPLCPPLALLRHEEVAWHDTHGVEHRLVLDAAPDDLRLDHPMAFALAAVGLVCRGPGGGGRARGAGGESAAAARWLVGPAARAGFSLSPAPHAARITRTTATPWR